MAVPDLDASVRGLYRAATGSASWDETLAGLRDDLGAVELQVLRVAPVPDRMPATDAALRWIVQRLPAAGGHGATLDLGTHQSTALSVRINWPSGQPPDAALCAWLDRLAPHLHDAMRAGRRLRQLPHRALVARALLDRLPQPAWLLQADGRITDENPAGRQVRADGRWLQADGTRLTPHAPAQQQALARALRTALAAPNAPRFVVVPVEPVDQAAPAGPPAQAHWLLRRLDRPSATSLPRPADEAVLLALLFDPVQAAAAPGAAPQQAAAMVAVYGFTPAESRVALHLVRGSTVREIAATLDVAPSTVRSHLDAVTAKLGVTRKLDAVRLLAQGGWLWRGGQVEGTLDA